jgi:hypothetical protein
MRYEHESHLLSATPLEQYERLISAPLKTLKLIGQIVVVIDALDECDDPSDILAALAKTDLPPNIRFIVTTRPETNIMEALESLPHVLLRPLGGDETGIDDDIHTYLKTKLSQTKKLDEGDIRRLTQKAEGLFQWASTACRYITGQADNSGRLRAGIDTRKRLNTLLSTDHGLDGIYRAILEDALSPDTTEREPVLTALAKVLASSVPLPLSTLKDLCTTEEERDVMDRDIPILGSVLDVRYSAAIRPLHTSFRDYLTDRDRSKEYFVDITRGHQDLASGAFCKMNQDLHFNMFDIPTSHHNLAALPSSVEPALFYSCRYWSDHLSALDLPNATHVVELVNVFATEKLLFWLEVICVAKCLDVAIQVLEDASCIPFVCTLTLIVNL